MTVLPVSESGIDNPQPNYTHELDVLDAVKHNKSRTRGVLPRLDDHFSQRGPHGDHYCFVFPVMGISLYTFRTASSTRTLAVHVVKPVLSCVLNALDAAHAKGIIHAGESQCKLSPAHSAFQNANVPLLTTFVLPVRRER